MTPRKSIRPGSEVPDPAAEVPAPSLTEEADATEAEDGKVYPNANVAESRSAALAALIGGNVPDAAPEAAQSPAPPRLSGKEQHWPDGDTELVRATVTVAMVKSLVGGIQRFGYRGDIIHAPAATIDAGVIKGAFAKES